MFEIKFTFDATPELIGALRDIAGAIHSVPSPMHAMQNTRNDCSADTCDRPVKCDAFDKAKNLTAEASIETKSAEAPTGAEEPKKRKPHAKKSPSESGTPVSPAIGDNSSPSCARAEPGPSAPEETPAEPEPVPVVADPAPGAGAVSFECASYIGARVSETPATDPTPVEEVRAATADDPLAGKGRTGEILAKLTREAIGDLDALGVDRCDANRRVRDYCARNDIKFPTFPALLQAVGYAEAIAICKGA